MYILICLHSRLAKTISLCRAGFDRLIWMRVDGVLWLWWIACTRVTLLASDSVGRQWGAQCERSGPCDVMFWTVTSTVRWMEIPVMSQASLKTSSCCLFAESRLILNIFRLFGAKVWSKTNFHFCKFLTDTVALHAQKINAQFTQTSVAVVYLLWFYFYPPLGRTNTGRLHLFDSFSLIDWNGQLGLIIKN